MNVSKIIIKTSAAPMILLCTINYKKEESQVDDLTIEQYFF